MKIWWVIKFLSMFSLYLGKHSMCACTHWCPSPLKNYKYLKSWPTFVEIFVEQVIPSSLLVPYPWVSLQESCPVLSSLNVASEPNQCSLRDFLTGWKLTGCFWIFRTFLTLLAWLVVNGKAHLSSLKWNWYSWIMCISIPFPAFQVQLLWFSYQIEFSPLPCAKPKLVFFRSLHEHPG